MAQIIFEEYLEFPMSPYDETNFNKLHKLLGSVEAIETAFELSFETNEEESEILNQPPTLWDQADPLIAGKNYRFTVKVVNDEVIFFINGKERSRRDER